MKNQKTRQGAALFLIGWLVAGMAPASVVYQDTFTTDGTLEGRAVETGTGSWQAHAAMMSSGGLALPAATSAAKVAALAFTPETNMIYTLSAEVNAVSNSWVALGFLSETNSAPIPGNGFFIDHVDTESPWMYTQPGGTVVTFVGPKGGGNVPFSGSGSNGTLQVVLDTSGSNWEAIYSFNGTVLRTKTFSGSLDITHVAFGGNPTSIQEVDNFLLEAVPAPVVVPRTVYDDFSSNDLSKWIDGTGTESTISVSNGALTWVGNAGTDWGPESITSTKSDFDLLTSLSNPLELAVDLASITPRTDADTSFEAFQVGWVDASGDDLQFIYSMRGASTNSDSVVQFKYNGSQIGGNASFPDPALIDGDTLICRWDGATVSMVRDRAGVETLLASRSFSDAAFTGTASAYLGMSFEDASGASITVDAVSTKALTGYGQWVSSWGVELGSETDDFDNDGLNNLHEYGLGGDPTDAFDQGTAPTVGIIEEGGSNVFSYVYPQLAADQNSGLTYSLELSSDLILGLWTPSGYTVTGTNVTGNSLDLVTNVTDTVDGKKYIRLLIESL